MLPLPPALDRADHALGREADVGAHVLRAEAGKLAVRLVAVVLKEGQGAPRVGLEGEAGVGPVVAVVAAQVELVRGAAVADDVAAGDGQRGHQGGDGGEGGLHDGGMGLSGSLMEGWLSSQVSHGTTGTTRLDRLGTIQAGDT